jgi:hypothetical protein
LSIPTIETIIAAERSSASPTRLPVGALVEHPVGELLIAVDHRHSIRAAPRNFFKQLGD